MNIRKVGTVRDWHCRRYRDRRRRHADAPAGIDERIGRGRTSSRLRIRVGMGAVIERHGRRSRRLRHEPAANKSQQRRDHDCWNTATSVVPIRHRDLAVVARNAPHPADRVLGHVRAARDRRTNFSSPGGGREHHHRRRPSDPSRRRRARGRRRHGHRPFRQGRDRADHRDTGACHVVLRRPVRERFTTVDVTSTSRSGVVLKGRKCGTVTGDWTFAATADWGDYRAQIAATVGADLSGAYTITGSTEVSTFSGGGTVTLEAAGEEYLMHFDTGDEPVHVTRDASMSECLYEVD